MTSDMGEAYKEMREGRKRMRAKSRESSTALLKEYCVEVESKNGGTHLIVTSERGIIDFWPGTGKWIARCGGKGRGVFRMLKFMKVARGGKTHDAMPTTKDSMREADHKP